MGFVYILISWVIWTEVCICVLSCECLLKCLCEGISVFFCVNAFFWVLEGFCDWHICEMFLWAPHDTPFLLFAGSLKCHLWLPLGWQWMSNLINGEEFCLKLVEKPLQETKRRMLTQRFWNANDYVSLSVSIGFVCWWPLNESVVIMQVTMAIAREVATLACLGVEVNPQHLNIVVFFIHICFYSFLPLIYFS